MKKRSTDLTQGNSVMLILSYTMPILMGQVFQNLYNSLDSIVVGNFVSTTALAAVTSCGDIAFLLVGFFSGLSAGAGVLFSRYYGAKNLEKLHDSIHTGLTFSFIMGGSMAAAGILLTPFLLRIVACPDDVWAEASLYLRIYLVGVMFTSIYNVAASVLRAVGNSRDPFVYLVIASCANAVLDLVSVVWLGMGVAGVAIATIISQLLAVILIFRNMIRTEDVYKLSFRHMRIDRKLLLLILQLGLPAAIQMSFTSISNLFVQRYVNLFGSASMAGFGAAKKLDTFVGVISRSLGISASIFVSQNLGAGEDARAFRGIRICVCMSFIAITVVGAPIYFFAPSVLRVFTSHPEALAYGAAMVAIMMPLYYLQALAQIFANAVRGFGNSFAVMILSFLGLVGCRQIFLYISMHINRTVTNVYYAYPVGWGCAALFVMLYYFIVVKRNYRKQRIFAD
jgi:putative MATE family efflux protein